MASPASATAAELFQDFDVDEASTSFLHDVAYSRDTSTLGRNAPLMTSPVSGWKDWDARLQCAAAARESQLADRSPLEGRDLLSFVRPVIAEPLTVKNDVGWAETDRLIQLLRVSLRRYVEQTQNKKPARKDAGRVSSQRKSAKSPYWAYSSESSRQRKPSGSVFICGFDAAEAASEHVVKQDGQVQRLAAKRSKHDHRHSLSDTFQRAGLDDVGPHFLELPNSSTLASTWASLQVLTDGDLVQPLLPRGTTPFDDLTAPLFPEPTTKSRSPVKSPFFAPVSPKPSPKKRRAPASTVSAIPFPPLSAPCFSLIQEKLSHDPFWLLIAVTFLIKTAGKLAIPTFYAFKERYPTPAHLADPESTVGITEMIRHLGLANNRTSMIQKYARIWLEKPPQPGFVYRVRGYDTRGTLHELPQNDTMSTHSAEENDAWEIGHMTQGKYALDSWRIFCRDELVGRARDWNGLGAPPEFQPEYESLLFVEDDR
ncbi:hypothetical protein ACHAQH_007061 [Verticillium albo-atrum]